MLRQVNRLLILPLVNVVESDIESDERVKVQLLKLINCMLHCVYDPRNSLLLTVEGAHSTLSFEGFLDEANNVLRFLLTGQLFLLATKAASKQDIHVKLAS